MSNSFFCNQDHKLAKIDPKLLNQFDLYLKVSGAVGWRKRKLGENPPDRRFSGTEVRRKSTEPKALCDFRKDGDPEARERYERSNMSQLFTKKSGTG